LEAQLLKTKVVPLFLRMGINQKEYTLGLGIEKDPLVIDYSTSFNELEILHRFGVTIRFGNLPTFAEERIREEWERIQKREAALKRLTHELKGEKPQKRQDSADIDNLRRKAQTLFDEGDYEKAQRIVTLILNERPNDPETVALEKAIQDKQSRDTSEIKFDQAKDFYAAKQYQQCLKIIEKIAPSVKVNTLKAMAHAQIYLIEEDYKQAAQQLITAVELDPDNQEAQRLYGRVKDLSETE
jgi:tetratricopeptide (TPR) repeat protein